MGGLSLDMDIGEGMAVTYDVGEEKNWNETWIFFFLGDFLRVSYRSKWLSNHHLRDYVWIFLNQRTRKCKEMIPTVMIWYDG